jgi:hypothetical protein
VIVTGFSNVKCSSPRARIFTFSTFDSGTFSTNVVVSSSAPFGTTIAKLPRAIRPPLGPITLRAVESSSPPAHASRSCRALTRESENVGADAADVGASAEQFASRMTMAPHRSDVAERLRVFTGPRWLIAVGMSASSSTKRVAVLLSNS